MKNVGKVIFVFLMFGMAGNVWGFTGEGCGAGECKDCHSLTKEEAVTLLGDIPGEIVEVKFSEVPGLWVVDLDTQGRKVPVYIDFSKQFLISGRILRLATKEDMTEKHFLAINKVDLSRIPLDDALVIGKPGAVNRIIVFDDPECAFCKKIHAEMKAVVSQRDDIAFYIKMFPLTRIHPKAYEKAKAIICEKSLKLLEDSLDGKEIPAPQCETDQVDKNLALGPTVFVKSTPTLIMPDGSVIPGFKTAEQIIQLLDDIQKESQPGKAGQVKSEEKKKAE
jgi:thiol:disulfide interchange protein DsbC